MRLITGLLLTTLQTPLTPAVSELHMPDILANCLESDPLRAQTRLRLVETRNPFYLRGDFDADGPTTRLSCE